MFDTSEAFSGFSVDDIQAAKSFYGKTLGLKITEINGLLKLHPRTGSEILVYPKDNHVPAEFTILNFPVNNIKSAVSDLKGSGVAMETFPGVDADGIFRLGGPLIAWFRDPARNILSVLEE